MNTLPPLPQAIHPHSLEVSPDYRAGWNDCHDEFTRAIAAQAPVPAHCWIVSGSSQAHFGEYAEHDATEEARRCGGSARAYPLHMTQQPTPVASPEQEREAFEVWFSQDREFPRAVERSGSSYKFMPAHVAWGVWQARAALAATASPWVSVDDRLPAGPAAQGAQP